MTCCKKFPITADGYGEEQICELFYSVSGAKFAHICPALTQLAEG